MVLALYLFIGGSLGLVVFCCNCFSLFRCFFIQGIFEFRNIFAVASETLFGMATLTVRFGFMVIERCFALNELCNRIGPKLGMSIASCSVILRVLDFRARFCVCDDVL